MSDRPTVHVGAEERPIAISARKRGRYKNHLALPNTYLCRLEPHILCHCKAYPLPVIVTERGVLALQNLFELPLF
jgi:hypothetical protein